MRKLAGILIVIMTFTLFTITGCSNKDVIRHNYTYKGENGLWTAEYKVNGTGTFAKKDGTLHYEGNSNNILTVTYKKEISKLSSIKHLEISYKSSASGGEITEDFDDGCPKKKTYTLKSNSTVAAIENKAEVIKVNVSIDGNTQTIELKNVQ